LATDPKAVKMLDKTGNFISVYIYILSNTTTAITSG